MSAKYLKVHIKPTNDEGLKKLKLFLKHVKDKYYEAVIEGAVTKDTNLVVSYEGAAAAEIAKAQDPGIRIITEKHFRDLV